MASWIVRCPVCGKGFESAEEYARHIRSKHPNVKTLCTSCGTCFPPIAEMDEEEEMDTSKYDWAMDVLTQRMKNVQCTMDLEPGEVPALRAENLTEEETAAFEYPEGIGQVPSLATVVRGDQDPETTAWARSYEDQLFEGAAVAAQVPLPELERQGEQSPTPTVECRDVATTTLDMLVVPETPPDLIPVSNDEEVIEGVEFSSTDEEDLKGDKLVELEDD